ncbi:MAG: sensor histidine kinase [Nitrososphaera sp.]
MVAVKSGSPEFEAAEFNAGQQNQIALKVNQDVMLLIDEDRIVQALSNIMNNAVKFTMEGQITVEANVSADRKLFEVRISDTGPGIPADLLPKLFTKFSPKTTGAEANKAGTGLGLFIAKSIIQAHGGHVYVGNNEEKGVTFVVSLPINDATVGQVSLRDLSNNSRSAVAT